MDSGLWTSSAGGGDAVRSALDGCRVRGIGWGTCAERVAGPYVSAVAPVWYAALVGLLAFAGWGACALVRR